MGAEDAVVIAVGGHIRFEFWWNGGEEVAVKGDIGRGVGRVGCGERSRGE